MEQKIKKNIINLINKNILLYVAILKYRYCIELNNKETEIIDLVFVNPPNKIDNINTFSSLYLDEVAESPQFNNQYLNNYPQNNNIKELIIEQFELGSKLFKGAINDNIMFLLQKLSETTNKLGDKINSGKMNANFKVIDLRSSCNNINLDATIIKKALLGNAQAAKNIINQIGSNYKPKLLFTIDANFKNYTISNHANSTGAQLLRHQIYNDFIKNKKVKQFLFVPNSCILKFNNELYGSWQVEDCKIVKNYFEYKMISNYGGTYPMMLRQDLTVQGRTFVLNERDQIDTYHKEVTKIEVFEVDQNDPTKYPPNIKQNNYIIKLTIGGNAQIDYSLGEKLTSLGLSKKGQSQQQLFQHNLNKFGVMGQQIQMNSTQIIEKIFSILKNNTFTTKDNQSRIRRYIDYTKVKKDLDDFKKQNGLGEKPFGIKVTPNEQECKKIPKDLLVNGQFIIAKKYINKIVDSIL